MPLSSALLGDLRKRAGAKLRRALRSAPGLLRTEPYRIWSDALTDEVNFWDSYFSTKGGNWPGDYEERLDPKQPLDEWLGGHLSNATGHVAELLDVGAGPLTVLGKVWRDKRLRITAVDPLADHYDRLLEKYAVTPPVRTTWCEGELLTRRFGVETFDLVYARNSLDHSYDPVGVIDSALEIVKRHGKVVLLHSENEAENEKYHGLHQWNFSARAGDFVIWGKNGETNMTERLRATASVAVSERNSQLAVVIEKQR